MNESDKKLEVERLRARLGSGWNTVSREAEDEMHYGVDFRRGDVVLYVWFFDESVMVGVYLEGDEIRVENRLVKIRNYVLSFVDPCKGQDACAVVERLLRVVQTRLEAVLDVVDASFDEVYTRDLVVSR
jgi:hypothetical protein